MPKPLANRDSIWRRVKGRRQALGKHSSAMLDFRPRPWPVKRRNALDVLAFVVSIFDRLIHPKSLARPSINAELP
jgi:hypothetical protein